MKRKIGTTIDWGTSIISIEAVARAWASIDGKLDRFDRGKSDPRFDIQDGSYIGYLFEAAELLERAKKYQDEL